MSAIDVTKRPTRRQKQILRFIRDKKGEIVTPKAISQHFGMTHSNANAIVKRLEGKGLLKRGGLQVT